MRSPKAGISWMLAAAVACTGCALLLPPSWRSPAPLPLAGPVDTTTPSARETGLDPSTLTDDRLVFLVESDQNRLVEIATQAEPPSHEELREIANRLPLLLRELDKRGTRRPGSRIRHPVIQ
jgi:hypothetical protein